MAEVSTEWISSRSRNRLTCKVASRAKVLEAQGWAVSWWHAGESGGKHRAQLILKRG